MKHILSLLLFVSLGIMGWGQSLSVASFNELPNDLDARVNHWRLDPQTGKKYAIIKVVTTQKGFVFDIGQLAMGGTEVHSDLSEIWVYVPEGTKKIKITHPQLGQLETESGDGYYWLPSVAKSAWCYRLKLVSGTVTTTVEAPKQQTGWLILKSNPSEADVYLTTNGVESLVGTTPFQQKLAYGDYRFRLSKPLYHDEVGMAQINQDKVEFAPSLSPAHGSIYVTSSPSGAKVSIDGVAETFTTPCTTAVLASGEYRVRVSKEKYAPAQKTIVVQDGKVLDANFDLAANFAKITINSISGADIYVNGNKKATTSFIDDLTPGVYDVEVRKQSHKTVHRQIEVEANKAQFITLNPTPIYGSLDVISDTMEATVSINGKDYGKTPTTIDNLLIGQYQVVLTKEGYGAETVTVTIEEGKTAEVNRKLNNGCELTFTSNPSGAELYVDGTRRGTTPATLTLTYGNHSIRVKNSEAENTDNIFVSATMSKSLYNYELGKDQSTSHTLDFTYTESRELRNHPSFILANFAYTTPIPSAGITIGCAKKWGWFASAMTSFDFTGYRTIGSLTGQDIPFLTGEKCYQRLSVLAGLALNVSNNFTYRLGLGYGKNNMCVHSLSDKWYRVSESSAEGIDVSFGVQFNMGTLALSMEGVTTNFSIFEAKVGIGVNF